MEWRSCRSCFRRSLIFNAMMAAAGASSVFTVDNSILFDSSSSEYLTFSNGNTPTNADVGTISFWFKRSAISAGGDDHMITQGSGGSIQIQAVLQNSDNKLIIANGTTLVTTQAFTSTTDWVHLVVRVDTSQGTAADRWRIYVNGSQITAFDSASYPSQNADIFNTTPWLISKWSGGTSGYFDGRMAEISYCDGQSLAPTSFGESSDGSWVPIDFSSAVTFGNNGFYLNFSDASALGDDVSGNNNDFTPTNTPTQSTDTPTS